MARKNKNGFTLIEILFIISIIAILVTIVLVSLLNAHQKSKDASAFSSLKSAAAPAFVCLSSGIPGVRIRNYVSGQDICSNPSAAVGAVWPDFSKNGWTSFNWCDIYYKGATHPVTCSPYANGSCGGMQGGGDFCFAMNNGSKYMWCTMDGCRKEGF